MPYSRVFKGLRHSVPVLALAAAAMTGLACSGDASQGGAGGAGTGDHADAGPGGASLGSGGSSGTGGAATGGAIASGGAPGASGGVGPAGGSGPSAGTGGATAVGGRAGANAGGGSTGAAGSGAGGAAAGRSVGCGMATSQILGKFVEQPTIAINGTARHWWIQLPSGYSADKAYPVIFLFHGCSDSNNNVPMGNVAGKDAILVRGAGISGDTCWEYSTNGPDIMFFDQMLATLLQKQCVDQSRIFAAGYSSGSWFINMLECKRGDKLRATGTVSGGTAGSQNSCVGQVARIFIHDSDDHTNEISGSIKERDRLLTLNHCNATAAPVPESPSPCARYQGCDAAYPVIWCQTSGKAHDRQDNLAPNAFWGLFSKL